MKAGRRCRLLICIVMATCELACTEYNERVYENLSEVEALGDDRRAWIPACLPEDAIDIREAHYVDSEFTWIAFNCASGKCVPAQVLQEPMRWFELDVPSRIHWWPADLTARVDTQALRDAGWLIGACSPDSPSGYVGILFGEPDRQRGFFVRIPT
jgi:hypothetical protein